MEHAFTILAVNTINSGMQRQQRQQQQAEPQVVE